MSVLTVEAPARRRLRRTSALPGFGPAMGFTLFYLGLIVLFPLAVLAWRATGVGTAGAARILTDPRILSAFRVSLRHGLRGGLHRHGLRRAAGLGADALPLPRPPAARRGRGPALRAADRGGRHRAGLALRAERLARRAAARARHQGRLHAARHPGGADLRRPALRGALRAAAGRGPRPRGRGGLGDARRVAGATLLSVVLPTLAPRC